jgi:hypothetical protein
MDAAWKTAFSREYARVSGETAEVQGPLGEMREYYRMDFSRCGGPVVTRARIERITAWLRGRASWNPQPMGGCMQAMIRAALEKLLRHVCDNESICCTRHELLARSQTKRMIEEARALAAGADEPEPEPETERTCER